MPPLLPGVDIGEMNLDDGESAISQGIAQAKAVVGKGPRIDHDTGCLRRLALDKVDESAFAVGLKGFKQGAVSISPKHANFFMNDGEGTADQVWTLIQTAREKVMEKFGVSLELEIELIGEWPENEATLSRQGKGSS